MDNKANVGIGNLLGFTKSATDLQAFPKKIRYQESTTVNPGQTWRLTFPKVQDDCLDCSTIRLRFKLSLTGKQAGETEIVDNRDIRTLFGRIRVISGSSCIADVTDAATIFSFLNHVNTSTNDSKYQRYLSGNDEVPDRNFYPDTREYITTLMPIGSLLNSESCIPLSRCNDLHVEFTMNTAAKCLFSTADVPTFSYNLSDVEILCTYIRSASLSSYFNSNPISYHVVDYSYRYSTILSQNALLRFQSSATSLDAIVTFLQDSAVKNGDIKTQFKFDLCVNPIANNDLFINNTLYYEEPVDSNEQRWEELTSIFPKIEDSEWFDRSYQTTKHLIGTRLMSTSEKFQKALLSGKKTSAFNTDITLRLNLTAPPATPLVASSFLISSVLIYLDQSSGNRGDLRIQY